MTADNAATLPAIVDWEDAENPLVKLFVGYDVEGYVEEYELRGDEGDYSPNEQERVILTDAIYGVISDVHEKLRKLLPSVAPAGEWQPIDTAPGMTEVIVWWPIVKLDDDSDPTDEVTGGAAFVSELQGGYWIEPDALNAIGDHMGDEETYAERPSHWMPRPVAPSATGTSPPTGLDALDKERGE